MRRGGPGKYALLLAGLIAVFYGAWIALWVAHPVGYDHLMRVWGIRPVYAPPPTYARPPLPFFDLEGVLSWPECARRGFDVYTFNPCDARPYYRVANYSPLLVDLPLEWIGTRNTMAAGFVMDGLFLALLPFLLRPRSRIEFLVAAAACTSEAVLYAVERANIDVLIFSLLALAAFVRARTLQGRIWLYGAALIGALVKFYPAVALGMMLRERLRTFLALSLVAALMLCAFAAYYWPEFARIGAHLPWFHTLSDMYGALALPLTIVSAGGLPLAFGYLMLAALLAVAAVGAFRIASRIEAERPHLNWESPRFAMFAAGCMTSVGCFVLQTNNSYRAILLLLTLPGLFKLCREARDRMLRNALALAQVCMLGCLWAEAVLYNEIRIAAFLLPRTPWAQAPDFAVVFVREAMWWFLMTVLAAGVICFVRRSAVAKEIMNRPRARVFAS